LTQVVVVMVVMVVNATAEPTRRTTVRVADNNNVVSTSCGLLSDDDCLLLAASFFFCCHLRILDFDWRQLAVCFFCSGVRIFGRRKILHFEERRGTRYGGIFWSVVGDDSAYEETHPDANASEVVVRYNFCVLSVA
jgi:hypothetical protein